MKEELALVATGFKHANRETWLNAAVEVMRPFFKGKNYDIPKIRVSCGWPSKSALGKSKRRIGEAWSPSASADGVGEIFISPYLSETEAECGVLATLVHEVVHQVVGVGEGHNKVFSKCARAVHLEGKLTSTSAGEELKAWMEKWMGDLGPYPHAKLDLAMGPRKKQTTRMIKCECPDCGYTIRLAQKWLDVGTPDCPACAVPLKPEVKFNDKPDGESDED